MQNVIKRTEKEWDGMISLKLTFFLCEDRIIWEADSESVWDSTTDLPQTVAQINYILISLSTVSS